MKLPLFSLGLISLALCASGFGLMAESPQARVAPSKLIEQSLETFAGTWEIVSAQPEGSTRDAKQLVFRKDRTYAALGVKGEELWAGTFDLDPTATPKIWDHRSHESQKTGGDALGIYELDGDRLKVCCVVGTWQKHVWKGKPRPTEFTLPMADAVLELRRIK